CLICFAGTDLGVDSASPFQPAVVRFAAGFLGVQVLHGSAVDSITITTLMVQAQLTTSFLVGL
uniref:Uncharacterized protein n=1 Tax=Aegilops tauschii subsp. strangulata TaxID=200361 RepID=A0A453NAG4_AEGTS